MFTYSHPDRYQHPYCIWDFVPASYSCPYEVERIGKMGDGGKWVCGMSVYENLPAGTPCVMYSFGVKDDSSFGKLYGSPKVMPHQIDDDALSYRRRNARSRTL